MKELASKDYVYERQMWPRQEAIDFFTKRGEPLKVQLIEEKTAGQPEVSVYTIKDKDTFLDFCVGPHVPSTGRLKAFKLTATSNAYWKGDAKNAPMQRVYGTAFFSQKELDEHLDAHRGSEEARSPQARHASWISFTFHPVAPGAAFWTPQGTTLYNTLVAFCRSRQKAAFQEIKTPLLYSKTLWEQSGHWGKYRENMFLVLNTETNEHDMSLKPMNCPSHHLYYGTTRRSYRELPLRFVTFDVLHRNELSGALAGLTRVRQFAQDDCHVYLREDQIAGEVKFLMDFILGHYEAFGLEASIKFATRPATAHRRRCDVGSRRGGAQERARSDRHALHDQRRRRRLLWTQDRFRRHGLARPRLAARDDPAGLRGAGALRPELRGRRQRRASAGRHPPRRVRHRSSASSRS